MYKKTILLVEDNKDDEDLTLLALAKYQMEKNVDVVRDGEQALDYIYCRGNFADRDQENKPQLILLDLKLPMIDGIEVLKAIRDNESSRNIPVVMLTTSVEDVDVLSSYENGANSFIRKPVDFNEFLDVVSKLGVYWLKLNITTH